MFFLGGGGGLDRITKLYAIPDLPHAVRAEGDKPSLHPGYRQLRKLYIISKASSSLWAPALVLPFP